MGNVSALQKNDGASAAAKSQEYLDMEENFPLNIAVTGETGSGKSSFVNAFRGVDNRDERAAPTGVVETTMEVTPYPHPTFPDVTLWDLPGIGSKMFPADGYLKLVGFEKFDFFIIVSADHFRDNDVKLAKEIQKMGKKFYFVRSKTDVNICLEESRQRESNMEMYLTQTRESCIQGLQRQGLKSPQVFLVSSFDPHLYDFPVLVETLNRELPELKRDAFQSAMPNVSPENIDGKRKMSGSITTDLRNREQIEEEIREALQNNDRASAAARIQTYLKREKDIPLHIAVTGESGAGKSTFVNAIRGIDSRDERAAPTGTTETTKNVTSYPHPNFPNVVFWDLPGVGTMKFPAAEYLKLVGFERFDFFIIISADRFTENDVKLAKEVQRMEKRFYFVRSKIDNNIRDERRSQREFSAERTLRQIREKCVQGLEELGVESQVFLVSSIDLHLYDFPLLAETLERELPELKRDSFLLAMPNISLEVIKRKKKAFTVKVILAATLSAAVAAVPLPGLSVAVDVPLLVRIIKEYVSVFGLDTPSLQRLANHTGVPLDDLMKVIKSPLAANDVTSDLVSGLLAQHPSMSAPEIPDGFFPDVTTVIKVLGILTSMTLSFTTTYRALKSCLSELADDAQRVFQRALSLNTTERERQNES
ncbi:interferon-inducible GTPase 5-like [Halichoeres trimaculatus]|uniref:interferon-inducible GTPase 5-like n=1 Tax=Halichoeres trimaculatus TaxID=147232 RepID=UPI003D9DD893